jgi:sugar lactone lactonase YvrE
VLLDGCTIPNGLVWSDDGATLYHADSAPGTITAYPYGDGRLGEGRVIYTHEGDGAPDGMCAGPDGTLWVAIYGGGAVRRITVEGEVVEDIAVEARQPTACWLLPGGQLVVTSAAQELEEPGDADGRTALLDVGGAAVGAEPFAG